MQTQTSPLGKGLSALLTSTTPGNTGDTSFIPNVSVSDIEKNPYQPRVNAQDGIEDLVKSVKEEGVMLPLIVTKLPNNKYRLIAGERRLTAARIAGLLTVPVIVKEAAEDKVLQMAIMENIQRKDLNPIEEASAYTQLKDQFKMSVKEISTKLGISQGVIEQRITLLNLPDFAKNALLENKINIQQADILLILAPDPASLKVALNLCIRNELSAKQLRTIVDKLAAGLSLGHTKKIKDDQTREMEIYLTKWIGKKIYFSRTAKGGKIIISFNNDNELQDIYKRFSYIGYHI